MVMEIGEEGEGEVAGGGKQEGEESGESGRGEGRREWRMK